MKQRFDEVLSELEQERQRVDEDLKVPGLRDEGDIRVLCELFPVGNGG